MEDNNQYDELLVRYLFNEETGEERAFVENWLNTSEENQRYFNRLKKVWQLTEIKKDLAYITDEANLEEKWNSLEQSITEEDTSVKHKPVRMLVAIAIAASVLLVIGLGWKFFINNKRDVPVAQHTEKKTDSLAFVVRHEVNTTGREKRIQLADGSLIILANNSEIAYREPFTEKRDITLIGKAYFKVAHDKRRPFTVISGDISTTAVGTEFTVTAFGSSKKVVVRLYEGKVVVKPVDKLNKKMKGDVYLLPGQLFVYDSQAAGKVKSFKLNRNVAPEQIINEELSHDEPSLPENTGGSWYQFNNQLLAEVFDQLSQIFNVPIVYDKKDIQNIYFTAKYNRTDSLENILKEIAILHNLSVTKKDNAFIISK
ncbi:FecR domain-containing protein [Chitinophaga sp. CF418]|uniref:FecR domain-containing protein n=1 Tax=Chitinophaga sp. CF418 TaxID=1855287 RepID=UPI00165F9C2F|nr:FecR domain-containing protein [Chitinophaga sp. CF418]